MCEGEEEEEYRAFVLNTKRKDTYNICTRRTYEQPRAKERKGGG